MQNIKKITIIIGLPLVGKTTLIDSIDSDKVIKIKEDDLVANIINYEN